MRTEAEKKAYQKMYRLKNKLKKQEKDKKHYDEVKAELKKIKEQMNFSNSDTEKVEEIYDNVFENNKSKNRAILHQNAIGKWWYEVEYNSKREPYISGFFDKRIQAISDLKVAL